VLLPSFPWKLAGALLIERSALNFTQGADNVNQS
jgi:hypothetical protein